MFIIVVYWENMLILIVIKVKLDIVFLLSNYVEYVIWNWYYVCVYYWLIKIGELCSLFMEIVLVIVLCFFYMRYNKMLIIIILKMKILLLFNRCYNFL